MVSQSFLLICPTQTKGSERTPIQLCPRWALESGVTPEAFATSDLKALTLQWAMGQSLTVHVVTIPYRGEGMMLGAGDSRSPGRLSPVGMSQTSEAGWRGGSSPLCPPGPGGSGGVRSPRSGAAAPLSPPGRAQPAPAACERQGLAEGSGAEGGGRAFKALFHAVR